MIPVLSIESIKEDTANAPKRLFAYFLASDNRQTFFYEGDVASLKHLVRMHDSDMEGLKEGCINALTAMYERYYKDVKVLVDIEPISPDTELHYIKFDIKVTTEDGRVMSVFDTVRADGVYEGDNEIYREELRRDI